MPKEAEGIQIEEKIDAALPLRARFVDEQGKEVELGDFFDGRRPVILTLNYYRCPMLCGAQLNGFLDALRQMKWTAGGQFRIVTVSFDPLEGPPLARAKKENYIREYGRPEATRGWHFLTGNVENIRALTQAVGFNYKWVPEREEWAHSAALILLTPDGRVARYLGGVAYDPNVLRLSLVEASEGRVGSLADQFFMWCFHYDPKLGRYTATAKNIMAMGGASTILVLGLVLLTYWRREWRRSRTAAATGPSQPSGSPPGELGVS